MSSRTQGTRRSVVSPRYAHEDGRATPIAVKQSTKICHLGPEIAYLDKGLATSYFRADKRPLARMYAHMSTEVASPAEGLRALVTYMGLIRLLLLLCAPRLWRVPRRKGRGRGQGLFLEALVRRRRRRCGGWCIWWSRRRRPKIRGKVGYSGRGLGGLRRRLEFMLRLLIELRKVAEDVVDVCIGELWRVFLCTGALDGRG